MLGTPVKNMHPWIFFLFLLTYQIAGLTDDTHDDRLIIRDPPPSENLPFFSERIKESKTVGIVRIIGAKEIQENENICGYEYNARIIELFKGEKNTPSEIMFMSFQPERFQVGSYYLAVLDSSSYTKNFLSKAAGDVIIEGHGNKVDLSACKKDFIDRYGDDETFFPLHPSYTKEAGEKWVVLNRMSMRVDNELKSEVSYFSSCEEGLENIQSCVKLNDIRKFICKSIGGCKKLNGKYKPNT